jgi:hypothetical protein
MPGEALPLEVYGDLIADVRASGCRTLVDLSTPRLDSALRGEPDLVKLNDWELAEFVSADARGAHSAAADGMSGRPGVGALDGTVMTGTGEVCSSSVVTVPSASCIRECGLAPSTIALASWR